MVSGCLQHTSNHFIQKHKKAREEANVASRYQQTELSEEQAGADVPLVYRFEFFRTKNWENRA